MSRGRYTSSDTRARRAMDPGSLLQPIIARYAARKSNRISLERSRTSPANSRSPAGTASSASSILSGRCSRNRQREANRDRKVRQCPNRRWRKCVSGATRTLVDPSFVGDSPFGRGDRFAARILRNDARRLRAHFVVPGKVLATEPTQEPGQEGPDRPAGHGQYAACGCGVTNVSSSKGQRLFIEFLARA